jgi:porphobilinogen synthase
LSQAIIDGQQQRLLWPCLQGWIDERKIALEILTSIKRAGADMILTYHAPDAARWLK